MAMNFWEAQREARAQTTFYIIIFVILTLATAAGAEFLLRFALEDSYQPPIPYLGLLFLALTFGVAAFNYLMYRTQGGGYVAESIGARQVYANSGNPREFQLMNIVQELALATSLPMPAVYIIPSQEINAFAAGLTKKDAAIAVSEGALMRLNRDELQGVIAHEFGHVYNGDMVISLRLAAMVMGFFFVLYLGLRVIQITSYRRSDDEKGGNAALIAAIILIFAGALSWFVGSILKASVSRQREYLADASAVQFTRNPQGIANALRKIAKDNKNDMPSRGTAYAHMYFEDRSSIFATHPPIWKRIAAIEGGTFANSEE